MNYYIDTEFLEGTQKEKFPISFFRKETPPTIDLISIGIVAEDGREYYAISKDFNLEEAWNRFDIVPDKIVGNIKPRRGGIKYLAEAKKIYWIRENVLKPIWIDLFLNYEVEFTFLKGETYDVFEQELKNREHDKLFTLKSLKALIQRYGKTNNQIAEEVKKFCTDEVHVFKQDGKLVGAVVPVRGNHEFYAYYADYDWVAFCWIFGKMIDLPKGFPMYCKDLKQEMDRNSRKDSTGIYHGEEIKNHPDYPKQENEHNALADARWNKKLHEFLNTI
jgi:hypothetical protein